MTKTDGRGGLEELAENYRREAQVCRRAASLVGGSQKDEWLRISAQWIRLAKEADAMCLLERPQLANSLKGTPDLLEPM